MPKCDIFPFMRNKLREFEIHATKITDQPWIHLRMGNQKIIAPTVIRSHEPKLWLKDLWLTENSVWKAQHRGTQFREIETLHARVGHAHPRYFAKEPE